MKTLNILYIIALSLLLTACNQQDSARQDLSLLEREVTDMFTAYKTHINTKGLTGVETYFSKSPDFYWVEDGLLQYPDAEALETVLASFAPSVKTVKIDITEYRVAMLSPERATIYADFKQDLSLESGFSITIDGIMTTLLAKEAEGWKFLNGHSSVEKPRTNQ